ncbi:methylosome subunit pICln, partial [Caerostris darwini]
MLIFVRKKHILKMVFLKNFPAPTEGIHHIEPETRVYFDKECLGKGTVHISENVLCWISSTGSGFSIEYRSITVHAVSIDKANFPEPCIFLMTDGKI